MQEKVREKICASKKSLAFTKLRKLNDDLLLLPFGLQFARNANPSHEEVIQCNTHIGEGKEPLHFCFFQLFFLQTVFFSQFV